MKPQRVLVTGAGGFLGCRLVERLLLGEKVPMRAMAHRPAGAVRLASLPVEIAWADITDPVSVEQAMRGCDVVVHCAYGSAGDRKTRHRVTVEGTRLLAKAALACGVRRFVHISTIAVYSYSPPTQVNEQTPFVQSSDPYCNDKIEAEEVIWKLIRRRNLPATVLRMGNIYGPFSIPWTVRPLAHIRDGYITLVDGGAHASNAVYVDNAVEAILLAIREEAAIGEAFFVTDDEVSWRAWYGRYASWLGNASLLSISSQELEAMLHPSVMQRVRLIAQDVRSAIPPIAKCTWQQLTSSKSMAPVVRAVREYVPDSMRRRWRTQMDEDGDLPPQESRLFPLLALLHTYANRTLFSNEKAKRVLGYGPLVSFNQAAQITEGWARWARLV